MPASTPTYGLPYPAATDPLANGDDAIKALAERVDLLLGESGFTNITPSAVNTTTSVRINYARSYAGLAPIVPAPFAQLASAVASTDTVYVWASAADATGFTLNIRASSTTLRNVRWHNRA